MKIDFIDKILFKKEKIIIAIDGNSGSGKSTFVNGIKEKYDCNIFHMDDFFLPETKKTKERLSEVGGNVDYIRFKTEVIDNLNKNKDFFYYPFDCKTQELSTPVFVTAKRLNIIEGVYSMHPYFGNPYDFTIFLSCDKNVQSERILKRSGALLHKRFLEEWIPLENEYFKNIIKNASIIMED